MDDAEWSEWTRPGVDSTNCTACSVCVGKSWRDRQTDRQFYRSLDGNAGPHREQLRPAERERTVIRSRSVPRRNPKAPSNDAELSAKASASSTWQTTTSAEYFSARISTQWKKFENRSIFCEEEQSELLLTYSEWRQLCKNRFAVNSDKEELSHERKFLFFSLSNTLLTIVSATRVFLTNGILFRPTALARRTSVTDGRTDRRTDRLAVTSVAIAGIPNAQCQANSC